MNVKLLKKVLAARDIKDPKLRKATVDKIIQEQMEEDEKASPLYNHHDIRRHNRES